jgi:hypothetical protein
MIFSWGQHFTPWLQQKKKRWGGVVTRKKVFFLGKDGTLLPHYEQLLFEVTIFRQYVILHVAKL